MRFQYLFSLSFLTAVVIPALSLPFHPSDVASYDARSLEDDMDLSIRDSFDFDLEQRDLVYRDFESLVPRAKTYSLKHPAVKKTAEEAKHRKDNVRSTVAKNQVANALKKAELQKQEVPKYGKPRRSKKPPVPNQPGYRADGRAKGFRLPKQPKTPKPNMVKKQEKSEKAKESQKKANERMKARKNEGHDKFKDAAAAHKATTGLPGRKEIFHVNGEHTYTGKDVRVANFNSHQFKNDKVGYSPKDFDNREQGPVGAKTKPLPNMTGKGSEFPLTAGNRGGYQGGEKGAARLITQEHTGADGKKTNSFAGVIAHDVNKPETHPGYNDHFQIHSS